MYALPNIACTAAVLPHTVYVPGNIGGVRYRLHKPHEFHHIWIKNKRSSRGHERKTTYFIFNDHQEAEDDPQQLLAHAQNNLKQYTNTEMRTYKRGLAEVLSVAVGGAQTPLSPSAAFCSLSTCCN